MLTNLAPESVPEKSPGKNVHDQSISNGADATADLRSPTKCLALLGPPGCGKGTQAGIICRNFRDAVHISAGDMMKLVKAEDATSLGNFLRTNWNVQKTASFAFELIEEKIRKARSSGDVSLIVLDGCIKVEEDIGRLNFVLNSLGLSLDAVVYLRCPRDSLVQRLQHRMVHLKSGRTYHPETNPPKVAGLDDVTGEPLTRRDDDDQLMKRYHSHSTNIERILDRLRESNLVSEMDATKSIDEVASELATFLREEKYPELKKNLPLEDVHVCDESTLLKGTGRVMRMAEGCLLLDEIALLENHGRKREKLMFAGPSVYPMEDSHFGLFKKTKYLASPKVDGIRYMVIVDQKQIAFINRSQQIFQVDPLAELSSEVKDKLKGSTAVLDGELVNGKDGGLHYIIFDALRFGEESLTSLHLKERTCRISPAVLSTWNAAFPIKFRLQNFMEISRCEWISQNVKSLPYATDGIVFSPAEVEFSARPRFPYFKWKPLTLITADCHLAGNKEEGQLRWTLRGRDDEIFEYFTPSNKESDDALLALKGKLIEFRWDPLWETVIPHRNARWSRPIVDKGGWRIKRIREDKTSPNPPYVLEKIRESVLRPISLAMLLEEIKLISK